MLIPLTAWMRSPTLENEKVIWPALSNQDGFIIIKTLSFANDGCDRVVSLLPIDMLATEFKELCNKILSEYVTMLPKKTK
jgi:hypothetical protein